MMIVVMAGTTVKVVLTAWSMADALLGMVGALRQVSGIVLNPVGAKNRGFVR